MYEKGYIYDVRLAVAGSYVTEDTAAGVTVLQVDDAVDFVETGGTLTIAGVNYEYVSADMETDTITLATPLAVDMDAADADEAFPRVVSKEAAVVVEDYEDAISARVPHSLHDRLALGIREDEDREYVGISDDSGSWSVVDVFAGEPVIDGSYIDPSTLPDPKATDGVAPATSPVPSINGTVGALLIRWNAVPNRDPVSYEVHVSTTAGFTPSAATLHSTTVGNSATIRTLPGGGALAPNTTYYVAVVARDEDGAAPASLEVGGQTVQVTSPDIASNYVYAGEISVGQLTGGGR